MLLKEEEKENIILLKNKDIFCWKTKIYLVEKQIHILYWNENTYEYIKINVRWKLYESKMAFVGGPSFRRRPWPFVHRRVCGTPTSATLDKAIFGAKKTFCIGI